MNTRKKQQQTHKKSEYIFHFIVEDVQVLSECHQQDVLRLRVECVPPAETRTGVGGRGGRGGVGCVDGHVDGISVNE